MNRSGPHTGMNLVPVSCYGMKESSISVSGFRVFPILNESVEGLGNLTSSLSQ